jgi:2,4'-dihydroxyacetophenone dioxygenase
VTATVPELPRVQLRREEALPFVDLGDGSLLQLLQVDLDQGLWIVRTRFQPGVTIQRHKHTGPVHAVTFTGKWVYLEYPEVVNEAGSYLFEPAGSIHTLHVPEDAGPTDVWFSIWGANLNLRDDDSVEYVVDAHGMLALYQAVCDAQGLDHSGVIIQGGS